MGTAYEEWQKAEGIPIHQGSYISNLYTLDLGDWARTGQRGAFVNLAEQQQDDAYVLEIAPRSETEVMHHLFEAVTLVLAGRGATTFWQEGRPKQTVEWQRGSVFSPPLNCYYQHFNGQGDAPARLFTVTNAPMVMNLFRNAAFAFGDSYVFDDRYSGEADYFSGAGEESGRDTWTSNFVPDIRSFTLIERIGSRALRDVHRVFRMSNNQMGMHCSEFEPGTYKKGHRHGVGATSSSSRARGTPCCGARARSSRRWTGATGACSRHGSRSTTSTSTPGRSPRAISRSAWARWTSAAGEARCRVTRSSTRTRTRPSTTAT